MNLITSKFVALVLVLSMSLSVADKVPSYRLEFENLPEEQRLEYVKLLREAQRLFGQQRIFEALDQIDIAERIIKEYPSALSIKGACLVEFRDFDGAEKIFHKALTYAPDNYSVLFNIGEINFVKGNWENAIKYFTRSMQLTEENSTTLTHMLAEFKIYICNKKLGKDKLTEELEGKYDYRSDNPSFYYINAVKAFAENNKPVANRWMRTAQRVFQPKKIEPWHDCLVEAGYLKSFYGGGDRAIDVSKIDGGDLDTQNLGKINQDVAPVEVALPNAVEEASNLEGN